MNIKNPYISLLAGPASIILHTGPNPRMGAGPPYVCRHFFCAKDNLIKR
ncbi:hypothetical protein CHCC20335_3074 [Bacillus paralicheniformis]|nr:hypothetical protein CHCC20335_3074 [Bacillus paralicheniformis]